MTRQSALQSRGDGTPANGERQVLELIAVSAPLDHTLDALCRVIDQQSGLMSSVFLLNREGDRLSLAAGPHLHDVLREATKSFRVMPNGGACAAAVLGREQVIVKEVLDSPLLVQWRDTLRVAGIGSIWSTPFFSKEGDVLGTFAVFDHESGSPSHDHLSLVARATHLASIAVERHFVEESLREEIAERRQAEEALRRSEQLFRLVLEAIPVGVAVVGPSGDVILDNPASMRIWGGTVIRSGSERYTKTNAWWHDTGKRIEPDDWASTRARIKGETSIAEVIDIETYDGMRRIIQNSAVPIRDEHQAIVGAVVVNEDISDRWAAERDLETSVAEMQMLATRLMHAQDDERRHIAQMLHETTAQDLAALKMLLARLNRTSDRLSDADRAILDESVEIAERSMSGVRTLSYLLHPPLLDETGLPSAVRWYAEGFAKRSGIAVDLDLPAAFERLPRDVETTLFRVVQEALINIHRHAQSPTAHIHLRTDGDRLTLEIRDGGCGMAPELVARLTADGGAVGVGIAGMRERLKQLAGTLDIESGDRGTIVRAVVPLPRHAS
jgi:PAS domain S-box-containing protein